MRGPATIPARHGKTPRYQHRAARIAGRCQASPPSPEVTIDLVQNDCGPRPLAYCKPTWPFGQRGPPTAPTARRESMLLEFPGMICEESVERDPRSHGSTPVPSPSAGAEANTHSPGDCQPGDCQPGEEAIEAAASPDRGEVGTKSAGDPPQVPDPILPIYTAPSISEPSGDARFARAAKDSPAASWIDYVANSWDKEAYGVPRVFDLFTLLAVMMAWALLFAFLQMLEPLFEGELPAVALGLGCYITLIAICQVVLFRGKKPRQASILGGPPAWLLTVLVVTLAAGPRSALDVFLVGVAGLVTSPIGFLLGYLAGGMVAGVFLLADAFRKRFMDRRDEAQSEGGADAIWGSDDQGAVPPGAARGEAEGRGDP